jgi:hypothetical protein
MELTCYKVLVLFRRSWVYFNMWRMNILIFKVISKRMLKEGINKMLIEKKKLE